LQVHFVVRRMIVPPRWPQCGHRVVAAAQDITTNRTTTPITAAVSPPLHPTTPTKAPTDKATS